MSSIAKLPLEVLLEIFRFYVNPRAGLARPNDPRTDRVKRPLLVSQICHKWRELATGSPALWPDIRFATHGDDGLSPLFFQRFRTTPTSLEEARTFVRLLEEAFESSKQFAEEQWLPNRIRSLYLVTKKISEAQTILSWFQPHALPALEAFSVQIVYPGGAFDMGGTYQPLLRETLTTLEIHLESQIAHPSVEGFRNIFSACPHLEILVLHVLYLDP
ncbi:hypothetical protein DFP72DRAFT_1103042 [Ephemerocybe angulata]|uniref:F-box domain-containing protein n=1 Tax=Ephemerocybe angulata TaxID=980116 RepID=A0A8H6HBR2_9AGAR|nr:hypothetical protein DFP72DRAFT_1103042 [Tulosesus angulatus]